MLDNRTYFIDNITSRLKTLGYSSDSANKLVAYHISIGQQEMLADYVTKYESYKKTAKAV